MVVTRHEVFVIGTRAQLIKVAPVVVACERQQLRCTLLMTGQHQETMQDLIEEFAIQSPQVPVIPASEHATVGSLVRWLPAAYRGVKTWLRVQSLCTEKIDVLVHGDTLSTLIGAWAGRRTGARVVHLESGLSSGRMFDPFPEELCRRLVFRIADLAMCPNPRAVQNLQRYKRLHAVDTGGNTIEDAVAFTGARPTPGEDGEYLLVSLHRFQNIYDQTRLRQLVSLIKLLAQERVVHFVLHPATRRRLQKHDFLQQLDAEPNINLSPRMGYGEFLRLAASAACVLTDGGSNQEELAVLGVPTIVMRARTERMDGLGANAVMEADVVGGVADFIEREKYRALRCVSKVPEAEGVGPSQRIVQALNQGISGNPEALSTVS